jgi:hypothetical protein
VRQHFAALLSSSFLHLDMIEVGYAVGVVWLLSLLMVESLLIHVFVVMY